MKFDLAAAQRDHALAVYRNLKSAPDDRARARAFLTRAAGTPGAISATHLDDDELDLLELLLARSLEPATLEEPDAVAAYGAALARLAAAHAERHPAPPPAPPASMEPEEPEPAAPAPAPKPDWRAVEFQPTPASGGEPATAPAGPLMLVI